ncbi:hypothetical protein AX16_000687 [Volvariella volvacea WC 439]|nr:hypothetical protein AX16_000687 [Volvariella volvacea WC 439]
MSAWDKLHGPIRFRVTAPLQRGDDFGVKDMFRSDPPNTLSTMRKSTLLILIALSVVRCSNIDQFALNLPCIYDETTGQLLLYQPPPKLPIPAPPGESSCRGVIRSSAGDAALLQHLQRGQYLQPPAVHDYTPVPTHSAPESVVTTRRQDHRESYTLLQPLGAAETAPASASRTTAARAESTQHIKTLERLRITGEEQVSRDSLVDDSLSKLPPPSAPEPTIDCNLPWCRLRATRTSTHPAVTHIDADLLLENEYIDLYYSQYLKQQKTMSPESSNQPRPPGLAATVTSAIHVETNPASHELRLGNQLTSNRVQPLRLDSLGVGDSQHAVFTESERTSDCHCECPMEGKRDAGMEILTVTSTIILTTTVVLSPSSTAAMTLVA